MHEVPQDGERTGVGVFERKGNRVANTEARTKVGRPKDEHREFALYMRVLCNVKFSMPMPDTSPAFDAHRAAVRERLRTSGLGRAGRGSVSWTINREIIVVAGWGRAILMQLAHPLVAAGVNDHSRFRAGFTTRLERLRTTVGAMRSLTFGDDEEAIAVAARINATHDRVFGRLDTGAGPFPAGTPYSAHAPELLRWVHATLVDSIPRAYELLVGPLTADERNNYCTEAAVMEPLLDITVGSVPRCFVELDDYIRSVLDDGPLAITDTSRALAHAVLFPPGWWVLWPLFRPVQLLTIGLLPSTIREAYGFRWTPKHARALTRWATALRWFRQVAPARVHDWPAARRPPEPTPIAHAPPAETARDHVWH